MEKSQNIQTRVSDVTTDEVRNGDPAITNDDTKWQPGYLKRFPYLGAAALLVVVLTAIGCAAVLYFSDKKSATQWSAHFAPNVALSVLIAIGNIALVSAVINGVAIAWWRKAMNGATIGELHQSWKYTSSTLGVLGDIFHLDVIGIAVLATKIAVIDSVLYQRATTTYVGQDTPKAVNMLGAAATTFPTTGFVVSEGVAAQTSCNCFMIGDSFTPVVNTWQTSNGFFQNYNKLFQECDGVCFTHIDAIGFEIDCDSTTNHTDIAAAPIAAYKAAGGRGGNSSAWTDVPIFNTSFYISYASATNNQSTINFNLQYFQSNDPFNPSGESCTGSVFNIQCKLRPALVSYPITITNFTNAHVTNGVALGGQVNASAYTGYLQGSNQNIQPYSYALKQAEGFEVKSYLYPEDTGTLNSTTALGGIANALHIALTSSATITYQGDSDWALAQEGVLSQTMMYGPPNMGSCDCSFRNEALDTIVSQVNQLAFLTATGLIDTQLVSFPATSSSTFSDFQFPAPKPPLTVNTSTTLVIQGVGSNTTTNFRSLTGTIQISDVSFYRTHYLFLGLGVGMTLFCVLMVLPLYWRYGELGRDVTMGPIEIAGAFGAPVMSVPAEPATPTKPEISKPTSKAKSNRPAPINTSPAVNRDSQTFSPVSPSAAVSFSNVDDLLAAVGNRKVVYGFVDIHEDEELSTQLTPQSPGAQQQNNIPQSPIGPVSPGGPNASVALRRRQSRVLAFVDANHGRVRPVSMASSAPGTPRV